MFFTGGKSEKALRLLPYLMPARRLVGKNKLTDIDYLTRCRKFFIDELTVRFLFFLVEIVLLNSIISLPVQELDNVHDRMKERKIGTILSTPNQVSLIYWCFSLGLFSAKIQFSLQLRYSLSFLNCLEAFKLRFFIRRTLWDLIN